MKIHNYPGYNLGHFYLFFLIAATGNRLIGDEQEDDYAWLEAIESPDNLYMRSGEYTGPTVQVYTNVPLNPHH